MAEKNITTWAEFKTALTEQITENTTYNIKNDLDATNDILTSNIICSTFVDVNKIFKGNGYKINGITAYGEVTVFYIEQNLNHSYRFYDINFTNFMIESGTFTNLCRNSFYASFADYSNLFVNCFFNGVCKQFTADIMNNKIAYFTKCSFNVRCAVFCGQLNSFDTCYIITTPLQDTNWFSNNATIINSYIEGVLKYNLPMSYLTPKFSKNNVFNCKVIVTNYSSSTTYKVYPNSEPVLINKDKLLQSDGKTPITNIAPEKNIFFLTDEQLRNKDYIQQNTPFPLYG